MTDYGSIPTDENGDNKDAKVTAATGKSSTLQLLVVFLAGVFIAVLACNFLASPSQVGLEDEAAKTTDNVITTLSKRGSSIELIRDDLLVFMKGAAETWTWQIPTFVPFLSTLACFLPLALPDIHQDFPTDHRDPPLLS